MPAPSPIRFRLIVIGHGAASGYSGPSACTTTTPGRWTELVADLEENGAVVDVRDAVDRDLGLAFRSPYVDPFAPPATVKGPRSSPEAVALVTSAVWGDAAGAMLARSDGRSYNAFDTVSLDLYLEYWGSHGARIARKTSSGIVWADAAPAAQ